MPSGSADNRNMTRTTELMYHIAGWILFVICAVLFLASGIQTGDPLLIAGSVVFLLACFLFLIPLMVTLIGGLSRNGIHDPT